MRTDQAGGEWDVRTHLDLRPMDGQPVIAGNHRPLPICMSYAATFDIRVQLLAPSDVVTNHSSIQSGAGWKGVRIHRTVTRDSTGAHGVSQNSTGAAFFSLSIFSIVRLKFCFSIIGSLQGEEGVDTARALKQSELGR
ncbi:hypothetical protein CSIM01_04798 [Colletotrichum simmondsii]|uniref:Uncharacterized protein n=1 Tax=Colletotrichum simmondsii TaxID=703756 RepID=A0A135TK16_9PEZI|nr:hypothetical protein CSIM01_04798 [Colletotrichum simmondsii]